MSRAQAGNETTAAQLAHRSIRHFTDEPLPEDVAATLIDVARHGASSDFYQHVTVIRVLNPAQRRRLFESSQQTTVSLENGELWIFVIDLHRSAVIRRRAGADPEPLGRAAMFLEGAEDTLIAAQNVVVAAESLGLGTVYLGSINRDPRQMIGLLGLPHHTFPLVGLLIGHPAEAPEPKPRLPAPLTVGRDVYPDSTDAASLGQYDRTIAGYYRRRTGNPRAETYTRQIVESLGTGRSERAPILDVLHEQGFLLS